MAESAPALGALTPAQRTRLDRVACHRPDLDYIPQVRADVAALLAAFDAQAAQLAAMELALRHLLSATDGPPWVLTSGEYLGARNRARILLAAGAAGEGRA